MAAFNPATAYTDEWQFLDGVQDAIHYDLKANSEAAANAPCKVVRQSIWLNDSAGQRLAAEAGVVRFLFFRLDSEAPEPKQNDRLEVEELNGFTFWTITTVEELRIPTLFMVSCTKAAQNTPVRNG